jgi:hypothetical protein
MYLKSYYPKRKLWSSTFLLFHIFGKARAAEVGLPSLWAIGLEPLSSPQTLTTALFSLIFTRVARRNVSWGLIVDLNKTAA